MFSTDYVMTLFTKGAMDVPLNAKKATMLALAAAMLPAITFSSNAALAGAGAARTAAESSVDQGYVVKMPEPSTANGGSAIQTLDPDAWAAQILVDQGTVMEGLVGYDKDLNIVPKIADHWTTSQDGLTWTFYLRKNAKWSNGAPVTANDFIYSWLRFASPQDSQAPMWESLMQYVANGWNYHTGAATADQVGLKAVNPYEIRITLAKPEPDLLGYMPLTSAMPLYKPSVEAHPTNWFMPQYFVSDAPYTVKSFVPNGKVVFVRNPKYVGNPHQVNVGNVHEIDIIPAPTTPVQAYTAGSLDVAQIAQPSDYQYAKSHSNLSSQVQNLTNWQVISLAFDKSTDASPLDNQLVRRAIAEALQRQVITDKVLNGMAVPTNVFGPPSWPTTKYEKGLPENVADAQKLLAKAGYPSGKGIPTLDIYTPPQPDPQITVAEAIAQELKQNLGINVRIDPTPWNILGSIIWGGYNKGIKPGYVLFNGVVNWWAAPNYDMQSMFATWYDYPQDYRDHVFTATSVTNNPFAVKEYGNPDNAKLGTKFTDFAQLQAAYNQDVPQLRKWLAGLKDPVYKSQQTPVPDWSVTWKGYVDAWHAAKTDAERHQAWVNAWRFIGNSGANGISGLDIQVWEHQHMGDLGLQWGILDARESLSTLAEAPKVGAAVAQSVIDSAFFVPLYDPSIIWLQRPWLKNVVFNKFSWGNYFQMQYLEAAKH